VHPSRWDRLTKSWHLQHQPQSHAVTPQEDTQLSTDMVFHTPARQRNPAKAREYQQLFSYKLDLYETGDIIKH
jgi:hypothetical protein